MPDRRVKDKMAEYEMHCECYIDINTEEIVKCELCEAALDMYQFCKELWGAIQQDYERIGAGRLVGLEQVLAKAEGQK